MPPPPPPESTVVIPPGRVPPPPVFVPPPLVPAKPAKPRSPLGKGVKIGIASAIAVTALAAGGLFFFLQANRVPSTGLVREQVEKLIGSPQLNLTGIKPTITPTGPDHATVAYEAEAEVREPLYEAADVSAVLRDSLKIDDDAWQRARKTVSGKTAPRILELAGLKDTDQALLLTTFLQETTAKGTKLSYSGSLRATKGAQGWLLESDHFSRTAGEERGKPRAAFPGATTLINDPAEMQKLAKLAAAQAEIPAKVEAARQAFLKERQAEQEKIIAQLVDSIKPGALYSGTLTMGSEAPAKVSLEIAGSDPKAKQVSAVLRNDGGWSDQRLLTGTFTFNPDDETLVVNLETAAGDAIAHGGPGLGDENSWQVAFKLSAGHLVAHDAQRDFDLALRTSDEAAALQKEIEAAAVALRAASAAGKIYRGMIRARTGGQTFDTLLRFADSDGEKISASLEPAGRESWQRPYHGSLMLNRYGSQGTPLRLQSPASEAIHAAPAGSPAAVDHDADVALQLLDGHFRGEGADFTYDFSPLSDAEVAKLASATVEREKGQLAIVKAGRGYPGTVQLDGSPAPEKVRLRFLRVDSHGTAIAAVIESLDRPGFSRELHGALDTFEKRLVLTTSGRSRANAASRAGLKFPAFVRTDDSVLTLNLTDAALSGTLADATWKLNFPVAGGVDVAADAPSGFPSDSGAYVWTGGTWQALPRNESKVSKSAFQAIGGLFSGLRSSGAAAGEKVSELTFTGHDTIPSVDGAAVVLIYVGKMKTGREEKYPQLHDYPEMEMAASSRDSNGTRRVILYRIVAGAPVGGFRDHRIAGTLDRISDTVIELDCAKTVPAGSYAVSVNEESFELTVQ